MIQIKHRYTNTVLCEFDVPTLREAVIKAVSNGADLRGADLYGANLRGADLYGEKIAIAPINIGGLEWTVCISESYLEIGCQHHTHDEWESFDDGDISKMHNDALTFWTANESWLLSACKAHRKESLAYRKANPEKEQEAA